MRRAMMCVTLLAGCASAIPTGADDAADGGFEAERRGGRLHARPMDRIDVAAVVGSDELPLAVDELESVTQVETADAAGVPLVHVSARQRIDGLPVHGTYVNLTFRDGGGDPTLVGSAYHVYEAPRVDTSVALGEDAAIAAAREVMRTDAAARSALEVWPVEDELALVWVVDLDGADRRALVRANGADAGQVIEVDARVYASGTVEGAVAVGGAPGGAGHPEVMPLADLEVTGGGKRATTDAAGHFVLDVDAGTPVTARLRGTAADVRDDAGAPLQAAMAASGHTQLELAGSGEGALAQVTAYHAVTRTRTFLLAAGFPATDLGGPVVTHVDVADSCNAYFDPQARTLSFFRSGGGCRNSAEDSIVAHEYGHFVDDAYGGIQDEGLSEGWGDVLACLSRGQPVIGPDLTPGEIVRTCDNDYVYPASGHDEAHALGQAWSGFVWHARQALGDAVVKKLVLPSLQSNAADIPAAVREVFLRDDDDGNLGNKTPHWNALWAAAQRHGLTFALATDGDAPAAVHDLAAMAATATSATVSWTAPAGVATYDLRVASTPITEATFAQARRVAAPDPVPGGGHQLATIALVPGSGAVYVALRSIDQAGNTSAMSNVVRIDPATEATIFEDGAEHGLGTWHATGLWHLTARRAATGGHAFWYGDEAKGSYQTGARTHGTLTSPAIELAGVTHPALALAELLDVELDPKFDVPTITVRDVDDASIAVSLGKDGGSTHGAFRARTLDLSPLSGRRVQIELAFDSVDGKANAGQGWYVDDVRIVGVRDEMPPVAGLVINEVMADPPAGWDAGGDGVASTTDDEYVELVNPGDAAVDVGGWTLADALRTRITFAPGTTIAAGGCLVVLGGGATTIAGAVVAPGGLSLNNSGDTVRVRRAAGDLVAELGWGDEGGHDSALVRQMDGDDQSPMVRHQALAGTPGSPGRRSDGSPWSASGALVINEVLADPPAGYDANGDGVASTIADEFVELVNGGTAPMDLGGATLSDGVTVRVTFAPGTTIAPGKALAVFGGATGLSLNNDGDTVTIRSAGGVVLASTSYGMEGGHDQSLVRAHDGDGAAAFVGHLTVSEQPASPGLRTDGTPF